MAGDMGNGQIRGIRTSFRALAGQPGGATLAAWVAHILAWGVGLWLAFGPAYSGVSAVPVEVNPETGQATAPETVEATRHTMTLIEANGLQAILYLLLPIALTGLSALAVRLTGVSRLVRKGIQWASAVALLAACAVAFLSIGLFYLPSAIALLVGACLGLPRKGSGRGAMEEAGAVG